MFALLRAAGTDMSHVRLPLADSDDVWARDHGPITVLEDGRARLLDFRFNGWGGKYPSARDDALSRHLAQAGAFGKTPMEHPDLVLEGGAIECDGAGTLLTTERCLLSPSRNPALGRTALEQRLQETLGVERILWLAHGGLAGDDTDGHIDTLARFTDTGTIVYQDCQDPRDEHFAPLQAMAKELAALRTAAGEPYRLIPLPLPHPLRNARGQRLPLGYANFLLINGAVLMPSYNDPADKNATAILATCFPEREIVPIDCRALTTQYGSLHCVTMQFPVEVTLPGIQQ